MNVALFWSFNETTYDTYSGLRAATELEAREVDQLWEHGKALRSKVQQMQQELEAFKSIMNKEQLRREKTRDKHMHTFSLGGQFLLDSMRQRRTDVDEEDVFGLGGGGGVSVSESRQERWTFDDHDENEEGSAFVFDAQSLEGFLANQGGGCLDFRRGLCMLLCQFEIQF